MPKSIPLFAVLLLSSLHAAAVTLTVHGQEMEVRVESYRPGPRGMAAHAVHLPEARTFEFKNGLKLELQGRVLLHDNGNIWMAQGTAAKAPVRLEIAGQALSLNCGERPVVNGIMLPQRILQFHPDGGYRLGCDVFGGARLRMEAGEIEIMGGASLDVSPEGELTYAAKIASGTLNHRGQTLSLLPGSELSMHDARRPAFFTLAAGHAMKALLPSGEEVLVSGGAQNASITLDAEGRLEKGVLAQDYTVPRLGYRAAKGTGLIYAVNPIDKLSAPYLSTLMLAEPVALQVAGVPVRASVIELSLFETVKSVVAAEAFEFRPPEDPTKLLQLPAGAKITLANTRRILKIEIPKARP